MKVYQFVNAISSDNKDVYIVRPKEIGFGFRVELLNLMEAISKYGECQVERISSSVDKCFDSEANPVLKIIYEVVINE